MNAMDVKQWIRRLWIVSIVCNAIMVAVIFSPHAPSTAALLLIAADATCCYPSLKSLYLVKSGLETGEVLDLKKELLGPKICFWTLSAISVVTTILLIYLWDGSGGDCACFD